MKKNLPLIVLMAVVVGVLGVFIAASFTQEQNPQSARDTKLPPAEIASNPESLKENKNIQKEVTPEAIEKADVPSADPKAGELVIWGEVKAVDIDKRVLTIDQHLDDNSIKISPNIPVTQEAIIKTKDKEISFAQVKVGDVVGLIVTKEGRARAVLVNY